MNLIDTFHLSQNITVTTFITVIPITISLKPFRKGFELINFQHALGGVTGSQDLQRLMYDTNLTNLLIMGKNVKFPSEIFVFFQNEIDQVEINSQKIVILFQAFLKINVANIKGKITFRYTYYVRMLKSDQISKV